METRLCLLKNHRYAFYGSALGPAQWEISAGGTARTLQKTSPKVPRKEKEKVKRGKVRAKANPKEKAKERQKGKRSEK